ncbi:MAG: FtsX-like permease family protein [Nanoarchaeota archaeon]|nr:FtsX-like permease family protein [Nanoarchaeota archaeon]
MNLSFFLAIKNLKSSIKLFFLVVSILSFSFINLSFFNSLNNGIEDVTNTKLVDYAFADLTIIPKEEETFIYETEEILKKVRSLGSVYAASPRLSATGSLFDDKGSFIPVIKGIDINEERYISKFHSSIERGSYLGRNVRDEVILGDELVGNLDGAKGTTGFEPLDLRVGQSAKLIFDNGVEKSYTVSGIMDTLFWIPDFYLLISIEELRDVYGFNEDISSEILIKINEGYTKEDVKVQVANLGINAKVIDSLEELSLAETILESQKITTLLANVIGIFSTFIVIFIIIYINVNNKKKQLSILKAVGISEKTIIKSYVILSLLYAVAGIIIGFIGFAMLTLYLELNPIKLPMGFFYPQYTILELLTSSLIIIVSSLFGGFFASHKTVRKNIVSVLRGVD